MSNVKITQVVPQAFNSFFLFGKRMLVPFMPMRDHLFTATFKIIDHRNCLFGNSVRKWTYISGVVGRGLGNTLFSFSFIA